MTGRPLPDALAGARVALCSACLVGFSCRYDGADKASRKVVAVLSGKEIVPVCPEVAGGLPVPRPPADFVGGDGRAALDGRARLLTREGNDVSPAFLEGARLALEAARRYGATVAVLKEGSPSCGVRRVVVDGASTPGQGIMAATLARAGVILVSDEDLPG